MEFTEQEMQLLKSIIKQWIETFDDEKAFPAKEYPDLYVELAQAATLLRVKF